MRLGEFAKLIRNRNTFKDLRDHHEFYQQPASLLSKETFLPTLSLYKVHVENFLKAIEKLLDKVFFEQNYKFWYINSLINFFLKEPGNLE